MTSVSDQKISDSTPSTLSRVGATPCVPWKHSRKRVERAGADVAVDDAERADGEGCEISAAGRLAWMMRSRRTTGR